MMIGALGCLLESGRLTRLTTHPLHVTPPRSDIVSEVVRHEHLQLAARAPSVAGAPSLGTGSLLRRTRPVFHAATSFSPSRFAGVPEHMRVHPRVLLNGSHAWRLDVNWERIHRIRFMAVNLGRNVPFCNLNHAIPPGRYQRGCVATVTVHYPQGSITKTGIVLRWTHGVLSNPKAHLFLFVDSPTNPMILKLPVQCPIIEFAVTRLPTLQRRRNILYARYRLNYFRHIVDRFLGSMPPVSKVDWMRGKWPPPKFQGVPVGRPPERFVQAFARCSLSLQAQ
eukprot:TRINITY_DN22244_c0_g1_i1.p1 TRINITY_DN22244_c0_g1~~TRINITY_DN22244_c0_g1_i1.p1  ORF type:complete len:281 (+),score=38.95 TRINITY_DN22244_c0_g1_i1:150-992(+)